MLMPPQAPDTLAPYCALISMVTALVSPIGCILTQYSAVCGEYRGGSVALSLSSVRITPVLYIHTCLSTLQA